jgi:hypothetical protein
MTDQPTTFVTPGPAEPEFEVLFSTRPDFILNLRSIAAHIAGASRAPTTAATSMTFAVYGRWGAGKSTALRYLQRLIEQATHGEGSTLRFSQYDAPLWERYEDARASLALQILRSAESDILTNVTNTLADLRGQSLPSTIALSPSTFDLKASIDFLDTLAKFDGAPPVLEQWLRDCLRDRPVEDGGYTHVVFVDDLDRCGHEFVVKLLAAMSYWSSAPGLEIYFVIAASREHLLEALAANAFPLGARTPEESLEKYVHLSVDMPDLLVSSTEVAHFMCALVEQVIPSSEGDERGRELTKLLNDSARADQPNSVFSPLLHPAHGKLTPRSVKHRFNTFMAEFKPEGKLNEHLVKRWILKAFWPEFWWHTLWGVETQPRGKPASIAPVTDSSDRSSMARAQERALQLREVGRKLVPFWGMPFDQLRGPMDYLARRSSLLLEGDEDPALAMYLAADPSWVPPGGGSDERTRATHTFETKLVPQEDENEERLADGGLEEVASRVVPAEREPSQQQLAELSHADQAVLLYFYANKASKELDRSAALANLVHLASIAESEALPAVAAPSLGNAALVAERIGEPGLALELYKAAWNADPSIARIAQNFANLALNEQATEEFANANRMINEMQVISGHENEFRTRVLALRLALAMGGEAETGLSGRVRELKTEVLANPTVERFNLFASLSSGGTGKQLVPSLDLRETARAAATAADTEQERYDVLESYGTRLYYYPGIGDENESARLFLYLFRRGLMCTFGTDSDAVVIEGYIADLLRARGYESSAFKLMYDIYPRASSDEWVRRNLALMLNAAGYGDAAPAALLGQRLPEISIDSSRAPATVFGSTQGDWWLEFEFSERNECPSPALDVVERSPSVD